MLNNVDSRNFATPSQMPTLLLADNIGIRVFRESARFTDRGCTNRATLLQCCVIDKFSSYRGVGSQMKRYIFLQSGSLSDADHRILSLSAHTSIINLG